MKKMGSIERWKRRLGEGRRHSGSNKAISTIMANLTMLIIVVFLSTLLFVWSVAAFGTYQGGAGYWFSSRSLANQERPVVENAFFYQSGPSYFVKIYVRNTGTIEFTIDSVYINSTHYNIPRQTVPISQVALLVGSGGLLMSGPFGRGDVQTITISSLRGTTETTQWVG